jgi:hypothetical protein
MSVIMMQEAEAKQMGVRVPWARKQALRGEPLERAYETCQRGNKAHCLNSNIVHEAALLEGRNLRFVATYKGFLRWSEYIDGKWHQFEAPLTLKYAQTIDGYDHYRKNFRMPVKCPMGPVRHLGICAQVRYTKEQHKERRARYNARVEAGVVVPGMTFRKPQADYVRKRLNIAAA